MNNSIRRIKKSSFIKNVTVMVTGAASAQALTMVFSPFITRIYGPEAFGILGTFNALVNVIVPIAALTYPIAIVLPKSDRDAKGIMKLSMLIAFIISMISLFLITFFNKQVINIFNLEEIANYLYLIPIVIVFSGLMQVFEQWLIRTKQFSINARVTFIQSLTINLSKVGIGAFHPVAPVLVILTAIGNGIRALFMYIFVKGSLFQKDSKTNSRKGLIKLAKDYYDFPLYRAPEAFLNSISNGLPVLMLTAFFGSASAGFYTLGRTVLSMPARLIGKAVGDVFYPRIADAKNKGENVTKLIKQSTFALVGIGIIPFGTIILFGPFLFSFIFGAEWSISGEYARWIALWAFSSFINRPSVRSLAVLNALKFHLVYSVVGLIIRLSVMMLGFYVFSSDIIAIALFGLSGTLLNFSLIAITLNISKK